MRGVPLSAARLSCQSQNFCLQYLLCCAMIYKILQEKCKEDVSKQPHTFAEKRSHRLRAPLSKWFAEFSHRSSMGENSSP